MDTMKNVMLSLGLLLFSTGLFAQSDLDGLMKKATTVINPRSKSGSLSGDEIVSGLKEALSVGAKNSSTKLSAVDGFFKDAVIKILMPPEVAKVENKLRRLGLGNLVDNAILSMNRAAEDASKSAAPIFLAAIKSMTLNDGLSILRGGDTSATAYLRSAT